MLAAVALLASRAAFTLPALPAAGGYAVLKKLMLAMELPVDKALPSFSTLKDYGNTSSSSTWWVGTASRACVPHSSGTLPACCRMGLSGAQLGMPPRAAMLAWAGAARLCRVAWDAAQHARPASGMPNFWAA
jgi:hypothetical protein